MTMTYHSSKPNIIGKNIITGEEKYFYNVYDCARLCGVTAEHIRTVLRNGKSTRAGWTFSKINKYK